MKVLGIDPALRNLGIIEGDYNGTLKVINAITYSTKSKESSSGLSDGEHDALCACLLSKKVNEHINNFKPDLICAEIGSGAQSHKAASALGAMKGFIGCLMGIHDSYKWVIVTPSEAKKIVHPKADKELIMSWVLKNHKEYPWEKVKKRLEHQADAVIISLAGINKILKELKNHEIRDKTKFLQ